MKTIEEMTVKEYIKYIQSHDTLTPKAVTTLESLYNIFDDKFKEKYIFRSLSPSQCPPNAIGIHSETLGGLLFQVRKCKNLKDTYLICVCKGEIYNKYVYYLVKTKTKDYSVLVEKLFNVNGEILKTIL